MKTTLRILMILTTVLMSCGVKGPPLPPVADDPAASEREDNPPKPTPSLKPKK